jgi:DNA invertase Pin-like site-specific DNA recombinase
MGILSKEEKKKLVIKLYKGGKNYQEIAKTVRISLRDIGKIINEYVGEKDTKDSESEN